MEKKPERSSKTSRTAKDLREILVIVRDTLCGFALLLLGFFLASVLDHLIPVEYPRLYVIWLAIGMIPFLLFAHWRGAFTLTWRLIPGIIPVVLILLFVPMTLFRGLDFLLIIVILSLAWGGHWIMRLLFPMNSHFSSGRQ